MKIVHISDIHMWRYTWDVRRLAGVRALGMMELLMGRAHRFQLERLESVVDRVVSLKPDHVLITGDLTTTALPAEFEEARRRLSPLLGDPSRVTVLPGNHDRTTWRSARARRFEESFGSFMPDPTFPWLRFLGNDTVILGLDATRAHYSPRGRLPDEQLARARELTSDPATRPGRLIIACHYPIAAPPPYARELEFKRLENARAVIDWLSGIGPHLYCCGHVHSAWAFRPPSLPNQLCLNAGAPLMRDSTGLRPPGFLEIRLEDGDGTGVVEVTHHAWNESGWSAITMLQRLSLDALTTSTAVAG